jgi:hypothetical protein
VYLIAMITAATIVNVIERERDAALPGREFSIVSDAYSSPWRSTAGSPGSRPNCRVIRHVRRAVIPDRRPGRIG